MTKLYNLLVNSAKQYYDHHVLWYLMYVPAIQLF